VSAITNARGANDPLEYETRRLTRLTFPAGTSARLDANGNRVATVGSDGKRSERAYDALIASSGYGRPRQHHPYQ